MKTSVIKIFISCIIIVLVSFFVFGRTLSSGFIYWDDDVHITANPSVYNPSFKDILNLWTKPHNIALTRTLWSLLAKFNNLLKRDTLDPFIFHLTNITFHSLSMIIVFFIVFIITGSIFKSLLAGLIFGVHPLQTEAVCWASGLKELLSGFFALFSILFFLCSEKTEDKRKEYFFTLISFLLFLLSLSSKTTSLTLPFVILFISKKEESLYKKILKLSVFFILSILAALLAPTLQLETKLNFIPDLFQRIVLIGESFFFYLQKFFLPFKLIPHYDRLPQVVLSSFYIFFKSIAGWIVIFITIIFVKKYKWLKSFVVFFLFLLPVLGFIPFIYQSFSLTADRYAYLALLGPALVVLDINDKFFKKSILFIVIVILFWSILSYRQSGFWKDTVSLFTYTVKVNPQSWVAYNNLGVAVARKDPLKSIEYFNKALLCRKELNPDLATSYYNLGLSFARIGDLKNAKTNWNKAVQIKPSMVKAWNNLGLLNERENNFLDALFCFKKSLELEPENPDILYHASLCTFYLRDFYQSKLFIEKACKLKPENLQYLELLKQIQNIQR